MALTPERIMELEQQSYVDANRTVRKKDCWGDEKVTYEPTRHFNMFMFARAIEAEVRKDDEALIRQMRAALECCSAVPHWPSLQPVIGAARARLKS